MGMQVFAYFIVPTAASAFIQQRAIESFGKDRSGRKERERER